MGSGANDAAAGAQPVRWEILLNTSKNEKTFHPGWMERPFRGHTEA